MPPPSQDALDVGYRYLDCAEFYGNEDMVGAALEGHSVKREDLYLVRIHNGLACVTASHERQLSMREPRVAERLTAPWTCHLGVQVLD